MLVSAASAAGVCARDPARLRGNDPKIGQFARASASFAWFAVLETRSNSSKYALKKASSPNSLPSPKKPCETSTMSASPTARLEANDSSGRIGSIAGCALSPPHAVMPGPGAKPP
ncbi:hypothetical protein [Paratractidigestivibacter sp.]|uniref:hypothetical protein n=1 Tax=Paratractidigestivibacter sp. TaxID=2847316 RepID=UPI002ABD4E39|nr:hypothetical protein [Paratractidigestivibacter sp.]